MKLVDLDFWNGKQTHMAFPLVGVRAHAESQTIQLDPASERILRFLGVNFPIIMTLSYGFPFSFLSCKFS